MNQLSFSSSPAADTGLLSGRYWGELRIFAEVARAKSFNRAAERLGISQPTIARKVRRLQDLIGAQLFVATKNGVRLTQRGEELASALLIFDQSMFAIASDLRARDRDAEGIVRINITDGLAAFFAAPAIPAFSAKHPRIQLHLRNINAFTDLRENQTDMMLTVAPAERADVVCRKLGTLHFVPIAARSYIARHGVPTRDTIGGHIFLQSHVYQSEWPVWADWQAVCDQGHVAHFCDNSFAYGMMVKQGLGIGLLGAYSTAEKSAVLVDIGVRPAVQLYAVALTERLASRPVSLVFDWLCTTFGETNPWFRSQLELDHSVTPLPSLDVMFDG